MQRSLVCLDIAIKLINLEYAFLGSESTIFIIISKWIMIKTVALPVPPSIQICQYFYLILTMNTDKITKLLKTERI